MDIKLSTENDTFKVSIKDTLNNKIDLSQNYDVPISDELDKEGFVSMSINNFCGMVCSYYKLLKL